MSRFFAKEGREYPHLDRKYAFDDKTCVLTRQRNILPMIKPRGLFIHEACCYVS
jgi:hypothetical protein